MKSVLVLAGGDSPESKVSMRSGAAVARALSASGYAVSQADPASDDWQKVASASEVVFPALHGAGGEDGQIQKQLEKLEIPFVGSGASASALCFDKWCYRQFVQASGLLIPAGELVDAASFANSVLVKNPFVLKPVDGGSSVDTLIARDANRARAEKLFASHPQMLLEELISGTEITVGVLGNQALPVIEIIPPTHGEFDYENKYNGASQELCPPKHISKEIQQKAQALALKVHKLCGCRDLSRSDFIVTANDEIYLLETNTIPGLTDQSLFPKAASVAGISMPTLVKQLVELAKNR